jgi:hypothetical protein
MRVPLPAARMIAIGASRAGVLIGDAASGLFVSALGRRRIGEPKARRSGKLADQDSNLDKQNQNLLCYRYTIGQ